MPGTNTLFRPVKGEPKTDKIDKNGQNRPKFSVVYAKRCTGLKKKYTTAGSRKTKVGVQLVRSFSRLTRDRKEWATKEFVLPKLKISESTKVFLGSF